MRYSIITPTYNRRDVVCRSIDSSLQFARAGHDTEIIVVDDASNDGTELAVRERYEREIEIGIVKLLKRSTNGGVTVARNEAAGAASGDWLVCLDSDDQLLPEAAASIRSFAERHAGTPILFFRCCDEAGRLIGPPTAPGLLDFANLLRHGTPGECLPLIARPAFLVNPYDVDLRGFEHLSYLRIVRAHGAAMLSDAVVRRYATVGDDRLSTLAGRLRRAGLMAQGFSRMLAEFGAALPPRQRAGLLLRVLCYRIAAIVGGAR